MTLPTIVACATPVPCDECQRGYATIRADFRELYPSADTARSHVEQFEQFHGHGFSAPELIVDSRHCLECHDIGARQKRLVI